MYYSNAVLQAQQCFVLFFLMEAVKIKYKTEYKTAIHTD